MACAAPAPARHRQHRRHARARHRRQHRRLLAAQRRPAPAAPAGTERGGAVQRQHRALRDVRIGKRAPVGSDVRPAASGRAARRSGLGDEPRHRARLHAHGRRARDDARQPAARVPQLLPGARGLARPGPDPVGRRGWLGRRARRGPEPRLLAAALRRDSGRRRPQALGQRRLLHDPRCRAARLRRRVARDARGHLGAARDAARAALFAELHRRRRRLHASLAAAGPDLVAVRRRAGAARAGGCGSLGVRHEPVRARRAPTSGSRSRRSRAASRSCARRSSRRSSAWS